MKPMFWVRWLEMASLIALIAFGLLGAAASWPPAQEPWRLFMDLAMWPLDGTPSGFAPEARLMNAIGGGITVGWGVTMWLLARGPMRSGDTSLAGPMLGGLCAWFVTDSAASIAANAPFNAALNVPFFLLFAAPLLALRTASRT